MLQGEESCADSVQQFCLIVERQTHSDAGNTYKCHKMMYAETFNLSLGLTMSTYCLLAFMLFPYFALLIATPHGSPKSVLFIICFQENFYVLLYECK